MRLMTSEQYNAICDLYMEQKKRIHEREVEIIKLKNQIAFLENLLKYRIDCDIHDIKDPQLKECFSELRFGD